MSKVPLYGADSRPIFALSVFVFHDLIPVSYLYSEISSISVSKSKIRSRINQGVRSQSGQRFSSLNPNPETSNPKSHTPERELFIDNLLVRIDFIIEMIWWTGLAPWEFEFPFPGSRTSTFLP